MKALRVLLILLAPLAFAASTSITLYEKTPSITTNAVVLAQKNNNLYGEVKAIAVSCSTNVTVGVFAVSGGMTPVERTIMDYTAVTVSGLYTNMASEIWVYGDPIELRTKSSSNAVNKVKVTIQAAD